MQGLHSHEPKPETHCLAVLVETPLSFEPRHDGLLRGSHGLENMHDSSNGLFVLAIRRFAL